MDSLRDYLKTLDRSSQEAFAHRAGTTLGYLRKALSTRPSLDGALVRRLWESSGGAVRRSDLRPDIWPPAEDTHAHHARAVSVGGSPNPTPDGAQAAEEEVA